MGGSVDETRRHSWLLGVGKLCLDYGFLVALVGLSVRVILCVFFFSSRRRHTRCSRDWSSDVCSSDLMIDPIRRLLTEAGNAKQTRAFWQAATAILSDWVGGARVHLVYKGLNESGTVQAGATAKGGEPFIADYHDAEGRHVQATFRGLPDGFPSEALRSALEIATHLAVMVARRAGLERERRLGTFLVELSRWLLAAPERELLLRDTLQSVVSLVEGQGAFVALRQGGGDALRIAATAGQCAELQGLEVGLTTSTTGRVGRTGEPPLADST